MVVALVRLVGQETKPDCPNSAGLPYVLLLPTTYTYTLESRCLMRETEEQRLEQLTLRMEGSLMMPRVVCAKKGLFLILGENRLISKSTQVCKSCKGK